MYRISRILFQDNNKHSRPTDRHLSKSKPEQWTTDQVVKTKSGAVFHLKKRPYQNLKRVGIAGLFILGLGYSLLVHREKQMDLDTKLKFAIEEENRIMKERDASEEDILQQLKNEHNKNDNKGCPYK